MIPQLLSWQSMLDLGWLIFLLLTFRYFWRDRQTMLQTNSWPITKGRINHCEWIRQGHRLWPKIEYIYHVDGQEFASESLFLNTSYTNPSSVLARKLAYRVANAYQQNKDIDVYYDPDKPELAVLDVSMPKKLNVIILLIAALIVLHGIMITLRLFKFF